MHQQPLLHHGEDGPHQCHLPRQHPRCTRGAPGLQQNILQPQACARYREAAATSASCSTASSSTRMMIPPPPPSHEEDNSSMAKLEMMIQALMTNMATGADLKRYNDDISRRIQSAQESVSVMGNTMERIENRVQNAKTRVTDMESWKQEITRVSTHGRRRPSRRRRKRQSPRRRHQLHRPGQVPEPGLRPRAPQAVRKRQAGDRIAHIRGFAPYGTPDSDKLGKDECIAIQTELSEMMSLLFNEETKWLQPFMTTP